MTVRTACERGLCGAIGRWLPAFNIRSFAQRVAAWYLAAGGPSTRAVKLALFSAGRPTMKLHALVVLSLVGLLGADTAKDDAVKKDLKKLQGTWTVVSMEMDGKFLPDESRQKIKLTIKGENFTFDNGDGNPTPGSTRSIPPRIPRN